MLANSHNVNKKSAFFCSTEVRSQELPPSSFFPLQPDPNFSELKGLPASVFCLVNVACSKLLQQNKVFQRVISDDVGGPVVPLYLGIFRAMSQLREEGRVAVWTVCPPSTMEDAGCSRFGSWSL